MDKKHATKLFPWVAEDKLLGKFNGCSLFLSLIIFHYTLSIRYLVREGVIYYFVYDQSNDEWIICDSPKAD